jgi:hypothetical protein
MPWRVSLGVAGVGTVIMTSIYIYRLCTGDGLPSVQISQIPIAVLIIAWLAAVCGHAIERAYMRGVRAGLDAAGSDPNPVAQLKGR